jgi:hypothetical protein
MESRKNPIKSSARLSRSSELPADFTKIVKEVYTTNFSDGLESLRKIQGAKNGFEVRGAIFVNEIVLGVSLVTEGVLSATTVYGSVDFDPSASSPSAQDLLNVCVDAVGSLYGRLLDVEKPERIEQLASGSLSAFEEIPLEWTKVEFEGRRVWLLVDKSNPTLDEMTDRWLAENDPDSETEEDEFESETESLFVTGKNKPGRGDFH